VDYRILLVLYWSLPHLFVLWVFSRICLGQAVMMEPCSVQALPLSQLPLSGWKIARVSMILMLVEPSCSGCLQCREEYEVLFCSSLVHFAMIHKVVGWTFAVSIVRQLMVEEVLVGPSGQCAQAELGAELWQLALY
jgi:hypothetical protein